MLRFDICSGRAAGLRLGLFVLPGLILAGTLQASPREVRATTAEWVRHVVDKRCQEAGDMMTWPLQTDGGALERDAWPEQCRILYARLSTARISRVFDAAEVTRRQAVPGAGDPWFADLFTGRTNDGGHATGMSLGLDCDPGCRIRALYGRLLHHEEYATPAGRDPDRRTVSAAQLASAISALAPLKTMLAEHYQVYGDWPETLDAMGVQAEELHSREIEHVELAPGGRIRAALNASFGPGRMLELVPNSEMAGMALRWNCRSNLPGEMLAHLRGLNCRPLTDPLTND